MKRHTRSSRRSTEDAMVASFGKGERSTRSRMSSDDLIIPDLPKQTRSRKHSSTDKKSELSKDSIGKRRHLSGSSKHRTRSHSGSDLWVGETSPRGAKGSKLNANAETSTAKDGTQEHVEKKQTNVSFSSSGVQIPKKASKGTTDKLRSKESLKTTDHSAESNRDSVLLKPSTSALSVTERTTQNSDNNLSLKHSNSDETKCDQLTADIQNDLQQLLPNKTKPTNKSPPPTLPNSGVDLHVPDEPSEVASNNTNRDNVTLRARKMDISSKSCAIFNEPYSQTLSGNVAVKEKMSLLQRVSSQRKGMSGEEPQDALPSVNKSLNPLATTMQADSKDDIQETSKRKLSNESEVETGNGKEDVASDQKRKRHRSSSRNLTTEFDNSLKYQSGTSLVEGGSSANSGKQITIEQNRTTTVKELSKEHNLVADVPTEESKLSSKTKGQVTSDSPSNASQTLAVDQSELITSKTNRAKKDEMPVSASCRQESKPPTPSQEVSKGVNNVPCAELKQSDLIAAASAEITTERTDRASTSHKDSTSEELFANSNSEDTSSTLLGMERHLAGPSVEDDLRPEILRTNEGMIDPGMSSVESKVENLKQQLTSSDVGYEASEWSQEVNEGEPFFFESDHLALKGNKDYRMLLRTLTTLEAQRKQATQDLECLVNKQKQALSNPISFVNKIQHNVDLHLPVSQRVVPLPEVNWEAYLGKPENSELLLTVANQKIKTRPSNSASVNNHQNCLCCKKGGNQPCQKLENHVASAPSSASTSGTNSTKVKPESKSETFNLPWTNHEQQKLEDLLVKFPMEAVEARRWEKIANELGNRTPLQVASRVQKYFIKLTRAGLPVPGRLPHSVHVPGTKKNRRTYPFMRPMPSTFLQSVLPPVYMNDNDSWDSMDVDPYIDDDPSDDESFSPELQDSEEYRELRKLRQMKREKLRQQSQMTHSGFHVTAVASSPSDDYKSIVHSGSHHLEPIRFKMEAMYVDNDYTSFQQQQGPYNYLDPNYNPESQPTL
ncbi:putative ZZ-type zinc finger-containing protein 3 [Apostichopus japonicus]|uniref:Putative ZZ-type zinc finger-containing protein 3 n=1 Tax=Stichopus japonicus TaxID=307972 RepID=A0A2G8LPD7_STIJA|nr:putative ZZ-type zinc finger-containing protein 3 [Apostichopus japonicus]